MSDISPNPIYQLRPRHAHLMAQIHASCFARPWPALDMAVHIQSDLCLGLGDPLMSFIIIRRAGHEAEILTLATNPSARRQGHARQLIYQAFIKLRQMDIQSLYLEVAEDNPAAIALYKICGFTPMGRRPGYYKRDKGRIAAITFSKSLDLID